MSVTTYDNPTASMAQKTSAVDYSFDEISMKENNDKFTPMSDSTNYGAYFKVLIFGFLLVIGVGAVTLGLVANQDSRLDDIESVLLSMKPAPIPEIPEHPHSHSETALSKEAGAHIQGVNPCDGKKPKEGQGFDNFQCVVDDITKAKEQAGANITRGYVGGLNTEAVPITQPYWKMGLCPVNVHWHLGAEHLSVGEFDYDGKGPSSSGHHRRLLAEETVREGLRCHHYDSTNPAFTHEYEWKHCVGMKVGNTYEVHWPHSKAGACGTPNQYQSPFYDGVLCQMDQVDDFLETLPQNVGVQGQVFTIINDDHYYYPDLIRGMIVDGEMGQDIAMYTGSTTGTSRDNEMCSAYSPITWQVDRKCHLISASSFDKMCADMKAQRDDMSEDLHAHGSREIVADHLTANNQQNK